MTRSDYTWDPRKAAANRRRHGVTFDEAETVFEDGIALTSPDDLHSEEEDREVTTGRAASGRLLTVVHVRRGDRVRIISAREATAEERRDYDDDEA